MIAACLFCAFAVASGLQGLAGEDRPADLVARMQTFEGDADQQKKHCTLLRHAALQAPPASQNAIVGAGGHAAAMQAMDKFRLGYPQLQVECAQFLGALAHWNHDLASELGNAGAIDAIAKSQKFYPTVYQIGAAVTNFADWPKDRASDNNLALIRKSGLFDLALDNFINQYHSPDAVFQSLLFFSNTCRDEESRARMEKKGFVQKAVSALKDYPHHRGMRGQVAWVNVECFGDRASVLKQVGAGAVPELVRIVDDFGKEELDVLDNSRAVKNALISLTAAATHAPASIDAMGEAGAIDALVKSFKHKDIDPDVVPYGCKLAHLLANAQWGVEEALAHELNCEYTGQPGTRLLSRTPWGQ